MHRLISLVLMISIAVLLAGPAAAGSFSFSTGAPDGRMAVGARPAGTGLLEIQPADDFILTSPTVINKASFTGLIPSGTTIISQVIVGIFRVFPKDSVNPPSGRVPTRVNSPSDIAFDFRDSASATKPLSFIASVLNPSFSAANSVLNGINPIPNQTTTGEGPVTGEEVSIDVTFTTPFILPADHYFFVPEVQIAGGSFLWLSTVYPANPAFSPDLEGWIRNTNLAPDWLRVGTDIVGGTLPPKFNFSFSLTGFVLNSMSALELLLLN